MSNKKEPGYWKIKLFEPKVSHKLSYDPGVIEFTNDNFPHTIRKTVTWAKGEGPYNKKNYNHPKILDVWNMLNSKSISKSLSFEGWVIQRKYECFKYILFNDDAEEIYTDIIGDDLACQIHFIEFIYILRGTKDDLDHKRSGKLIDYSQVKDRKIKSMCDDLDSALGN